VYLYTKMDTDSIRSKYMVLFCLKFTVICTYIPIVLYTNMSYFILLSDIDECVNSSMNKCSDKSLCSNIAGSYQCKCPIGAYLQNDKRTCTSKCACIIYMYKYYWLGEISILIWGILLKIGTSSLFVPFGMMVTITKFLKMFCIFIILPYFMF